MIAAADRTCVVDGGFVRAIGRWDLTAAVINGVISVRGAAWTIDFFTITKLTPLVLLIVLGLPQIDAGTMAGQAVADPDWTQAILIMMFAFGGFESALLPAGEMRNPKRDIGFALLVGLAVVTTVYVLLQVVVIGVVTHASEAGAPLAAALGVLLGPAGLTLASIAAMVSVYGWMTGATLAQPRMIRAMAERASFRARSPMCIRVFAHRHSRSSCSFCSASRSPWRAASRPTQPSPRSCVSCTTP